MRVIVGAAAWFSVYTIYTSVAVLAGMMRRVRRPKTGDPDNLTLMVTGRFESKNWCKAHLLPLAAAENLKRIIAVVDGPVAALPDKVEVHRVANWVQTVFGRNLGKLFKMLSLARTARPDIVMGYHIFPGALTALLVARSCGAGAVYQVTSGPMVGGAAPTEIYGGGAHAENPLLRRLAKPSPILERRAVSLCRMFDTLVVRGSRSRSFFESASDPPSLAVIPGSVDMKRFAPRSAKRDINLATSGRLAPIKQPEQFIAIAAALAEQFPELRSVMIGSGPLANSLKQHARNAGVADNIEFTGHVDELESFLVRSKVFVLTSSSEGLSLALAEAMAAGAVPVVADVGDLPELVENGVTGRLIQPNDIDAFAAAVCELLQNENDWREMSRRAQSRVRENNSIESVAAKWTALFRELAVVPAGAVVRA